MNKDDIVSKLIDFFKALPFQPSKKTVELIVENSEVLNLKSSEVIVDEEKVDDSLYLTVEGVTKIDYFNGNKDLVIGFGGTGALFVSPSSYYFGKPGCYRLMTETKCVILKMTRNKSDLLLKESPEFTRWMFESAMRQFAITERKLYEMRNPLPTIIEDIMNGDFDKKLRSHNPARFNLSIISQRDLASYLGITPSHLAHIKKDILSKK